VVGEVLAAHARMLHGARRLAVSSTAAVISFRTSAPYTSSGPSMPEWRNW
jgi:hypothetical protein